MKNIVKILLLLLAVCLFYVGCGRKYPDSLLNSENTKLADRMITAVDNYLEDSIDEDELEIIAIDIMEDIDSTDEHHTASAFSSWISLILLDLEQYNIYVDAIGKKAMLEGMSNSDAVYAIVELKFDCSDSLLGRRNAIAEIIGATISENTSEEARKLFYAENSYPAE